MGNLATHAIIASVDINDRVIGSIDRALLPTHPTNFRVVHVFVRNTAGDLLLQHIGPDERSAGRWGSSVAGYVLAGETYLQACRRKIRDELGVNAETTWVGKTSMPDLGATKFMALYLARTDGPFAIDPAQASEVRFFSLADVRRRMSLEPQFFTDTFKTAFQLFTRREQ